jgi:hypothetical protein
MPANTTPRRSAPTFAIAAATAPVIAPLRSLPSSRPRKFLLALALVWIWLPAFGNADTIGPFNPIGPFGVQVWGNGLNGSNYLGLAVQVVAGQVATAGSSTDGTSSANGDFFGAQTVGVSGGTTGFFFAQATAQLWDTVTFSNFLPGQSASVNMILTNSFLGNFASGSEELLVKIGNTMQFADGTTAQLGGIRNLSVTFPLVNDVPTYFFAELSVQAPGIAPAPNFRTP